MVGFIHHHNYALQYVDILNLLGFRIDEPNPNLDLVRKRIRKLELLLHPNRLQLQKTEVPQDILDCKDRDINATNLYVLNDIIGMKAKVPKVQCEALWNDICRLGHEGFVQRWDPMAPTPEKRWSKYYPVRPGETASAFVISSDEDEDQDEEEIRDIPRNGNKDISALLVDGNTESAILGNDECSRKAPQALKSTKQNAQQPLDIGIGIDKCARPGAHNLKSTKQKVQQTLVVGRITADLSQGELGLPNLRALAGVPTAIVFATVHGPSNSKDKPHQYVVVASLDKKGRLNIRVRNFTLRGEPLPTFGRRISSYTFDKTKNEGTLIKPFEDERSIYQHLTSSEDVRNKDSARLETGGIVFATIPGPLRWPEKPYQYTVVGSLDKNKHLLIRIRNVDMDGKRLPPFGRRAGKHARCRFKSIQTKGKLIEPFSSPLAVRKHLQALEKPSSG
jgi:hypothetical protein